MKRESNFGIVFRHYLKANPFKKTTWCELKQTTTNSISFSVVKEHQLNWLLACKHNSTNYKIPDDTRGIKPVDYIFSIKTDAVIVIKYPNNFYIIDIDIFIKEKKISKRKSLLEKRASEISIKL